MSENKKFETLSIPSSLDDLYRLKKGVFIVFNKKDLGQDYKIE